MSSCPGLLWKWPEITGRRWKVNRDASRLSRRASRADSMRVELFALCFAPSAESRCHTVHDTSQAMHARRTWGFPAPSRACRQKALLVDIMAALCVCAEVFSAITSISQLPFQLAREAKTVEFYILSEISLHMFCLGARDGLQKGARRFLPIFRQTVCEASQQWDLPASHPSLSFTISKWSYGECTWHTFTRLKCNN